MFNNKNLFHCYHHNRGYCTFQDKCRYKHFKEICSKTICREQECDKRHPVICRYRDDCKFNKTNNCAFKHINTKMNVASLVFENKIKAFSEDIEGLKREIVGLKNIIDSKEEELLKRQMEIKELNIKLMQKAEKDIVKENDDLKICVEVLEKESKALKLKLVKEDQMDVEKSEIKPEDKPIVKTKIYPCEKCCLNFSSKEKLSKHISGMHKAKLTF